MPVVLYHAGGATYTMVTIVSITTTRWGIPPRSTPSFQHPPLKRMLHSPGLKPAPSDCQSDVLPLHQSAKVTAKDERDVFSLFSQCSHSPPAPHATEET